MINRLLVKPIYLGWYRNFEVHACHAFRRISHIFEYLIFSEWRRHVMHLNQFPQYLKEYPNRNSPMPLHISINRLDHGFPPHRHDFLELEYVIEGRGTEFLNGVAHPMLPGTLTFILPYQIHEIRTEPGQTLVLYNCMFSMGSFNRFKNRIGYVIEQQGQLARLYPIKRSRLRAFLAVASRYV